MDKAGKAVPVVFGLRIRQGQMPLEVIVFVREQIVLFIVEALTHTPRTVPEADLALGIQPFELIKDMATHGRHTRATTDEDHFRIGFLGEKLTEGSEYGDLVTRFQVEDVGAHDPGLNILGPRRRRRDTDIELQNALFFRVVGHGIGTNHFFIVLGVQVEEFETFPVTAVFLVDVKVGKLHIKRRRFQLHITTRAEIHVFAFRQFQRQLFNESGNVIIGNNLTLPLLHAEEFFRHLDLHVLLHVDLAAQAPAIANLPFGEVAFFGGKNVSPTVEHLTATLRTGTTATAGGGQENTLVCQSAQQLTAGGRINAFFGIVVNIDVYVTGCHQTGTGSKNHRHQRQHNGSEHDDTENNLNTHDSTLPLQLHAGK